jgi:hypothetical protein
MRRRTAAKLSEYMSHCTHAERYAAARLYCEYGKELASAHPEIHDTLAKTLYHTGQFLDLRKYCPTQHVEVASALRMTGLYREHLRDFSDQRELSARIHIRMRHFDIVLREFQDVPDACVSALCYMGRYREAADQYPGHCARALLGLKQYRQVLDRFPEDTEHCIWALTLMGKHTQAMERAGSDPWPRSTLLLYRERVDEILSSPLYEQTYQTRAAMLNVILLLERNQTEDALSVLPRIRRVADPDFKWGQSYYLPEILIPFIQHVLGIEAAIGRVASKGTWRGQYSQIAQKARYCFQQQLWHDLQYLLDELDDKTYLTQPCCLEAPRDLVFLKAMKADYAGHLAEAVSFYTQYQNQLAGDSLACLTSEMPFFRAFVRWRLNTLRRHQ